MKNRNVTLWAGMGCGLFVVLVLVTTVVVLAALTVLPDTTGLPWQRDAAVSRELVAPQTAVETSAETSARVRPTFTPSAAVTVAGDAAPEIRPASTVLTQLYENLSRGVVNIRVLVANGPGGTGVGAGSGFVLDDEGHIVTNHHVIDQATEVIVVFYDGTEALAEIVGSDDDSDLAVLHVDNPPAGVQALPLGSSDQVQVGDWSIAIGNPFGLGSSMTLGIVSAVGRSIPSGATPFSIPQAIQTDTAINPGNSGGPLLNLDGQVVGVNAQIRTTGAGANSGVGFAIPVDVVRHVAPQLIEFGMQEWPWLGVEGASVNLLIMEANDLEDQFGAYIAGLVPGGPADEAGLRGTQGTTTVDGFPTPVGGDVVVAVDGQPVRDFDDLLSRIAFKHPGETVELTILRDGRERNVEVILEARPEGPDDLG